MIGVDTNILARYYVLDENDKEATKQHAIAVSIMKSARIYVSKSVLLELEWVLRGFYSYLAADILKVFDHLVALPGVKIEDENVVIAALNLYRQGFDFADALHHASNHHCHEFLTFDDRRFARRAKRLGIKPQVIIPTL